MDFGTIERRVTNGDPVTNDPLAMLAALFFWGAGVAIQFVCVRCIMTGCPADLKICPFFSIVNWGFSFPFKTKEAA